MWISTTIFVLRMVAVFVFRFVSSFFQKVLSNIREIHHTERKSRAAGGALGSASCSRGRCDCGHRRLTWSCTGCQISGVSRPTPDVPPVATAKQQSLGAKVYRSRLDSERSLSNNQWQAVQIWRLHRRLLQPLVLCKCLRQAQRRRVKPGPLLARHCPRVKHRWSRRLSQHLYSCGSCVLVDVDMQSAYSSHLHHDSNGILTLCRRITMLHTSMTTHVPICTSHT
jgi:hypothetical protein